MSTHVIISSLESLILTELLLKNKVHHFCKSEILSEYQDQYEYLTSQVVAHAKSLHQAKIELKRPSQKLEDLLLTKLKTNLNLVYLPAHLLKNLIVETITVVLELHIVQTLKNTHPNPLSSESVPACGCFSQRLKKFFLMDVSQKELKRICNPYLNTDLSRLLDHGTEPRPQRNEIPSLFIYISLYMFCQFVVQLYYQMSIRSQYHFPS